MKDKTVKILLGIIAANLTFQTLKDASLFSIAHAQNNVQKVTICDEAGTSCAGIMVNPQYDSNGSVLGATRALRVSADGVSFSHTHTAAKAVS